MYVTIHYGNFRRIYYSYTRIRGSLYALRPGSEEVKSSYLQLATYNPLTAGPEYIWFLQFLLPH